MKKKLLNLSGDLSARLNSFFESEQIEVVAPEILSDVKEVSFILTKDVDDFNEINLRYETIKNNILIFSLSPVKDTREFLLMGGRAVLDESFMDERVGNILLRKSFQERGSIHLDEIFGSEFSQYETCKLSDHLRIGHYSDEISISAFENDFNIVSVRGFIYNIIYYYTYLQQAGIGSAPFEIEYASNENIFAVNLHLAVKNFVAEYLYDCFGELNSNDPVKYLLKSASLLADNTDITYIENPSKIVITGFWSKQDGEKSGHSGQFLLNNIKSSKHILDDISNEIEDIYLIDQSSAEKRIEEQNLRSKPLPGNIVEMMLNKGDPNSVLNKEPQKAVSLMSHIHHSLEKEGINPALATMGQIEQSIKSFADDDFINQISDSDKKNILEKTQKKNLADVFEKEIQRARGELDKDTEHLNKVKDSVAENIAEKISSGLDASFLNSIVSGFEEEDKNIAIVKGKFDLDLDETQIISGKDEDDKTSVRVSGNKDEDKGFNTLVSGNFDIEEESTLVNGVKEEEDKSQVRISSGNEIKPEDLKTIVSGQEIEKEKTTLVLGGKESNEQNSLVKGSFENENHLSAFSVHSIPKEDEASFKKESYQQRDLNSISLDNPSLINGELPPRNLEPLSFEQSKQASVVIENAFNMAMSKIDPGEQTIDFNSFAKEMKNFIVGSDLDSELANIVAKSSEHFIQKEMLKNEGFSLNEIPMDYLSDFKQNTLLPTIDTAVSKIKIEPEEPAVQNFQEKLQTTLAKNLHPFSLDENGQRRELTEEDIQSNDFQKALQSSVKEVFQEQLKVGGSGEEKFDYLKKQLKEAMSENFSFDEDFVNEVVNQSILDSQGQEAFFIQENLFDNIDFSAPMIISDEGYENESHDREEQTIKKAEPLENNLIKQKMKEAIANNKKLESQLQVLKNDLSAKEKTIQKLKEIEDKVGRDISQVQVKGIDEKQLEKRTEKLKNDIEGNTNLSNEDKKQIKDLLEREKKLLSFTKKAEIELKKLQTENSSQKNKFTDEIATLTKTLSSKDGALNKAKEHIKEISKKKEKEVKDLEQRIEALNKTAAQKVEGDESQAKLKKLEREKQNLEKMLELYKNKSVSHDEKQQVVSNVGDSPESKNRDYELQLKSLNGVKSKLESELTKEQSLGVKLKEKVKEQSLENNKLKKEKDELGKQLKNLGLKLDEKGSITPENLVKEESSSNNNSETLTLKAQLNKVSQDKKELEGHLKSLELKSQEGELSNKKLKELMVESDKLKKELRSAHNKMELSSKPNSTTKNNAVNSGELLQTRSELKHLKELEKKKDKQIDHLENELKKVLNKQVEDSQTQSPEIQKPLANTEAAKLKLSLLDSEKKARKYEEKTKELERRVDELNKKLSESTIDKNLEQSNSIGAQRHESQIQKELDQARKTNKFNEERIKKLETDLRNISQETGDAKEDKVKKVLQDQLDASNSKAKKFELQVKDLMAKVGRLEADLRKEKASENKTQLLNEGKYKTELLAEQRKVAELDVKLKDAQKKLEQAEAAKKKAFDDVKRLGEQNQKDKLEQSSKEAQVISKQDDSANERKVTNLETQVKNYEKQVADLNGKVSNINQQLLAEQKKSEATENRFKQESLSSKRQIQEYENKMKEMEKTLQEMGATAKGGQEQVNMTKYKQLETSNKTLMKELSLAKQSMNTGKSEATKLKAENNALTNKIKQLEKEVQRAKIMVQNLNKTKKRKAS